jgi:hypothetical protein
MPVPGAFPIVKLGALAIRQIAKPLANLMKERARTSPFFRTYICMPPAQFYHWLEVNVKMRMLNLGKPKDVKKLDENAAIDLGADLLGEFIIFGVAAGTLTLEFMRQSRNAAKAAAELEERWDNVEEKIHNLEKVIEKQNQTFNIIANTLKERDKKPILEIIKETTALLEATAAASATKPATETTVVPVKAAA